MAKFAQLADIMRQQGLLTANNWHQPEEIDPGLIALTHAEHWINAVRHGTWTREQHRRVGLPWSPELAQRSLRAVDGTWRTVQLAWQYGAAGHLAGGTHHAFHDFGSGYCLFNDLAGGTSFLSAISK